MSTADLTDLYAAEHVACPYAAYAHMRKESPVHWFERGGYFLVTRHEDVREVALSPERFSSNFVSILTGGDDGPTLIDVTGFPARPVDVLAIADAPAHGRQRRMVNRAFSMRRVQALEGAIRARVHRLMDAIDSDPFDWAATVATPLPVGVIAELVGLPADGEPILQSGSDASVALLSGVATPAEMQVNIQEALVLQHYLVDRYTEAKEAPGDDVMGILVEAARAGEVTDDEVISILVQLVIAGSESTTSLLASALRILLQQPETCARLREDPSLVSPFVEEALRLETPFQGNFRVARVDTELGGVSIKKGDRLMLTWASANRDEACFDDAADPDIERPNLKAHLGFGEGIHRCVGAPLARAEARIALEVFLERCPDVSLVADQSFAHLPSVFVRRLEALWLTGPVRPAA